MSSLVKSHSKSVLNAEKLDSVLGEIKKNLHGRVKAAYIFGSASTGDFKTESDIDLILIVDSVSKPFVERGMDFKDLFEIYPNLDLLVYTEKEFREQLSDSALGFWKSVRLSLKKVI